MKKLLTAILLLFMSSTLFAQGRKSLITPQMAKRTAYLVSYTIEIDKEGKMRVKPTDIKITDSFSLPLFGQFIANPASQGMYFVAGFTLKAF